MRCTFGWPVATIHSENSVPTPEEIVRSFGESLSNEQGDIVNQLSESLVALDAYQTALDEWKSELAGEASKLASLADEAPKTPHKLTPQQAADLAMTAELDQARAEVHELRELLDATLSAAEHDALDEELIYGSSSPRDSICSSEQQATEVLEPAMTSVAKQFHKLRKQQASRRAPRRGK